MMTIKDKDLNTKKQILSP